MKYVIWILRIALGLLFIFSGVVKANDPLGLTYKMNEFFEVWGWSGMVKYSFALSVAMIAFEIIAGVAMIVGNAFRTWIFFMLLINIFYTFLTYYALYSGNIHECGCFGDCFKISNTATFEKDVALLVISLFLFIFRYRVFAIFDNERLNIGIVSAAAVFAFGAQFYTLHHLPVHDCLPYKVGNNIWEKMKDAPDAVQPVYQTSLVYEKNGVKKTFTQEEYIKDKVYEDKAWKWDTTITTLVKEGSGLAEIPHDFSFIDADKQDNTEKVLTAPGYTFLWFVRDPAKVKADGKEMEKLHNIIAKANAMHAHFYVLASVGWDLIKTYQEVWNMKDVTFYTLDATVSKTAMRTDPGLMLLNSGVVEHKWSYSDYPKDVEMNGDKIDIK